MPTRVVLALFTLCLCAAAGVAGVWLARAGDEPAAAGWQGAIRPPGARLPDFALTSQDGERVTATGLRGRPVVVTFLYPGAVRSLMKDFVERARRGETPSDDPLTPREVEIVKLIAEARTTREIAADLVLSEKTVERHRTNILAKLGMRDRVELVRYAIRRGLVEP